MRIIVATSNKNKLLEIKNILNTDLEILSLEDIGYEEDIKEYGHTLHINALIKAQTISSKYPNDLILADDSGLFVTALGDKPGVYSARYAKDTELYKKDRYKANNLLLLENLKDELNREAIFRTVICLIRPNNDPEFFSGELIGEIGYEEQGENAFGYDPIFLYKGKTLAQRTQEQKDKISHRKKAISNIVLTK